MKSGNESGRGRGVVEGQGLTAGRGGRPFSVTESNHRRLEISLMRGMGWTVVDQVKSVRLEKTCRAEKGLE